MLRDAGVGVSLVSSLKKTDLASVGGSCTKAGAVKLPSNKSAYDDSAINAYFVASSSLASSWNCGPFSVNDPKIIFVSLGSASDTTLPHEIGHALSLSHFNGGNMVSPTNVMCSGVTCGDLSNRRQLGLGQVFRANANAHSSLNLLANSTWQTRCCPDSMKFSPCATLTLNLDCLNPELSNPLQP